jgi:hypothetical protein
MAAVLAKLGQDLCFKGARAGRGVTMDSRPVNGGAGGRNTAQINPPL